MIDVAICPHYGYPRQATADGVGWYCEVCKTHEEFDAD